MAGVSTPPPPSTPGTKKRTLYLFNDLLLKCGKKTEPKRYRAHMPLDVGFRSRPLTAAEMATTENGMNFGFVVSRPFPNSGSTLVP